MGNKDALTENEFRRCRKSVREFILAAGSIQSDLRKISKDILKLKAVPTIDVIDGEQDINRSSKILKLYQRRRSLLSRYKLAASDAHWVAEGLYRDGTAELMVHPAIMELRNGDLRVAAVRRLLAKAYTRRNEAALILEQVDTLLKEIRDNQRALEYQVLLYKEKVWPSKHGVE